MGGAEGNRTPVQTYSSKAFYMLISLLVVGDKQEMNKPIHRLAVPIVIGSLKQPSQPSVAASCFVFMSAAGRGNRTTCPAALMTT